MSMDFKTFYFTVILMFIGAKLLNVSQWSWFWALIPIWGPGAVILVGGLIMAGFSAVFAIQNELARRKRVKQRGIAKK